MLIGKLTVELNILKYIDSTCFCFCVPDSAVCQGSTVFLAGISRSPFGQGYTWTQATATCADSRAEVLKPLAVVSAGYFQCVEMLMIDISATMHSHLRAWSSDCNSDNSACAVYDINYFDNQQDLYRRNFSVTTNDRPSIAMCHQGTRLWLCIFTM